ncbi:MAG: hypothetical protein L3J35_07015 [Bacteroidales bacterium]|nr:hypothetical protein [Bacteroidales bacterium]
MGKQKRISDKEFLENYGKHHNRKSRSDLYVKEKDGITGKGILFWIFLAIVFLVAYYLFSNFLFSPQS